MSNKRIISLLLAVVLVVSLVPHNVASAEEIQATAIAEEGSRAAANATVITVADSHAAAGATVNVDITIKNNPGILAMTLKLNFNESIASLIRIESGDAMLGMSFAPPVGDALKSGCQLGWDAETVNTDNVKDGIIATLTFKIADDAALNQVMTISVSSVGNIVDDETNPIPVETVAGKMNILDYIPGDVNSDGLITSADTASLRRYIAGGYGITINEAAGDVNADGLLTSVDVTFIRRYIAGGYGITLKPSTLNCQHKNLTATGATAPTCSNSGNIAYWHCAACGKYFSDAEANNEISYADTVLDVTDHTYATDWSYDEDYHWFAATCEHTDAIADKASHRWDTGEVLATPSVDEEGETLFTCLDCGYEKYETSPMLPSYTVTFYNAYDRPISSNNYRLQTAQVDIPSAPVRSGYRFDSWIDTTTGKQLSEIDFTTATEGTVFQFTPYYIKIFKVAFVYYNDNGQLVEASTKMDENHIISAADLPEIPARDGYTANWGSAIGTKVTNELTFTAIYEAITYTVTFLDTKDGNMLGSPQTVEAGSFAIIPAYEPYHYDDKKGLRSFTGWKSAANGTLITNITDGKVMDISSNLVLYAAYETSIDTPIMATHISKVDAQAYKVTMTLCMPSDNTLYVINMTLGWTPGIGDVKTPTVADTTSLNANKCSAENQSIHPSKSSWLTYSNKNQTLNFVWGCGNGHTFTTDVNLITFTMETTDLAVVTEAIFSVLEGSTIIYGETGASNITNATSGPVTIWFY